MIKHLDDNEFASAIADTDLSDEAARHLADCLFCRSKVADMEKLIGKRREQLMLQAPDFKMQQQQILAKLPSHNVVPFKKHRRWLQPVLAAAASVMIAIAVGIGYQATNPVATQSDQGVPVEEILAEVDAILDDSAYPGFEPLQTIVPENTELESYFQNGTS